MKISKTARWAKFASAVCLGALTLLTGCSDAPGLSDLEPQIREAWKTCQWIRLGDFKKINGIALEKGVHKLAISFKLEVVTDIPVELIYGPLDMLGWLAQHSGAGRNPTPEEATEFFKYQNAESARITTIANEKCPMLLTGSVVLIASANGKGHQPLKKGEVLEVSIEQVMVKSDNGWIVRD